MKQTLADALELTEEELVSLELTEEEVAGLELTALAALLADCDPRAD